MDETPNQLTWGTKATLACRAVPSSIHLTVQDKYPSIVDLAIYVRNTSDKEVAFDHLAFAVRKDHDAGALVSNIGSLAMAPDQSEHWRVVREGDLAFRLKPNVKQTFAAHESVSVRLTGVRVSRQPGEACIDVRLVHNKKTLCTEQIWVPKTRPPLLAHLTADKTSIEPGQTVRLTWNTTSAAQVKLLYNGREERVEAEGFKEICPAETTCYTIRAEGEGKVCTSQVHVEVHTQQPIEMFKIEPNPITDPDQEIRLTWKTRNASGCSIDQFPGLFWPGNSGSHLTRAQQSAVYTLRCWGAQPPVEKSLQIWLPFSQTYKISQYMESSKAHWSWISLQSTATEPRVPKKVVVRISKAGPFNGDYQAREIMFNTSESKWYVHFDYLLFPGRSKGINPLHDAEVQLFPYSE